MTVYFKFKTGNFAELHDVEVVDHDRETIYAYMENGTIKRCLLCDVEYFTLEYSTGHHYTCHPEYK